MDYVYIIHNSLLGFGHFDFFLSCARWRKALMLWTTEEAILEEAGRPNKLKSSD